MKSIRLKTTIHLNGNHALSINQLNALKPPIEKGIAASLPDHIAVDTINVTKVVEMKIPEGERARSEVRPLYDWGEIHALLELSMAENDRGWLATRVK
jgi:hypothetical protein